MRSEYQKRRERLAVELEEKLQRKIAGIQKRVYSSTLNRLSVLRYDKDGLLSFNVKNITTVNRIAVAIEKQMQKEERTVLKWLVRNLLKLFKLNVKYFSSLDPRSEQREQQILFRVMLRYGYNTKSRKLTNSGVLTALNQSTAVSSRISQQISQSLAAKIPMKQFKTNFRTFFVNPAGLGVIESQFNRFAQDIFQDFDRETQRTYADELNLNYAIYSGTEIKTTRDFCEARINNIYSRKEIAKWNSKDWKGKRKGVPVEVQCGGYNCRHHFSFISDELAKRLAENRGGLNQYN
jgi:hypothetical protein